MHMKIVMMKKQGQNKIKENEGVLIIIADHGNCDIMWNENHKPVTSHTTNPVPCSWYFIAAS